ncbi:hypothetical protein NHL50_18980 [Acidimicrobiia bacterium EGI L10123]|uniref:hypothetical protein n=1 Tax=Salinilacustrithrix flava TaxID=2957203 RepID=UPI003D7C199E|nr:hypothetical protein [Acidimicrobiia bacterium EGI L10123]
MVTVAAMRILAHQGGWDEILFVLAPLLIFGGLLALARKRVDQMEPDDPGAGTSDPAEDREGSGPS